LSSTVESSFDLELEEEEEESEEEKKEEKVDFCLVGVMVDDAKELFTTTAYLPQSITPFIFLVE